MNNVEAKFILQGYRPNGADAADGTFAAALDQTRRDPALGVWFEREQAFDRALSAKLAQIAAPAGLRESILAGGRVTAPAPVARGWWRHPALMAAAAGVAVIFATSLAFWPQRAVASGPLVDFAVSDALNDRTHGGHGPEAGALQAMLREPATRLGASLPVDFATLRKTGCRTMNLEGRDVLEVCFKRNGTWFHCYIARRSDFPALVASARPMLAERNGAGVAAWADATHLYVLVTPGGHAAMEKLL